MTATQTSNEQADGRARIKREAETAATQFTDVNDACPYPFTTWRGQLFREHFLACRAVQSLPSTRTA